ncbi:phospholipase D/nuclease, partial [Punctularia strigosozonata HHB-11173 SS5]
DHHRAIALSLQDTRPSSMGTRDVINVDDDSDDEFQAQLAQALKLSAAQQPAPSAATTEPQDIADIKENAPPATTTSFLSDRAQLEKERLARQKRLRGDVNAGSNDNNDDDEDDEDRGPTAKRRAIEFPPSSKRRVRVDPALSSASGPSTSSRTTEMEPMFWNGEIRQTANAHVDPRKDTKPTFRLTEIIGKKSDVKFAIIAGYCIDWAWLYHFFEPSTPVVVVAQPDTTGARSVKEVLPNWIRTTPPLRGGRGCMHMKFMLLFYRTGRLRVVISTANFIDYDWRDIENTVWVQDVPLRQTPIRYDHKATDFPATFERVFKALNVEAALQALTINDHPDIPLPSVTDLRTKWDFSKVKAHLVASVAGKHEGWPEVIRNGHTALMKAVRDMGARAGKGREVELECQGSSIGTYSTQWMNEFHYSCRGESAEDWLDQPKTRRAKLPWPPVKIVFPSLATVQASRLGEKGGGTIFCRSNQWQAEKFPRELFHDSRSKRGPVLMHSKMVLATFRPKGGQSTLVDSDSETESETESESDEEVKIVEPKERKKKLVGWIYVGSHNFTPSAWGNLSGSAFGPIMNITNYEIGIVLPLTSGKEADAIACWERPPRKYVPGKDVPWVRNLLE